ncbi:MAG: 23S rRNA (adenine(2503)-C(2))-methyltransferase RlmN [Endomicrobiales bacterium]|nr:23S rRNA (adenine(2503)-C(2))-methyltransferase RlmN [Endomicrobiales bacterium]
MKTKKRYILDLEPGELAGEIRKLDPARFRIKQILSWVYAKKAPSFDVFSDVPAGMRRALGDGFLLRTLTIAEKTVSSADGTARYDFRTMDGQTIPAVLLPAKDRTSACISTQIGCPAGCSLCRSGKTAFKRNLTRGEILEQLLAMENDSGRKIGGVLFMGMGEPLFNLKNLESVLRTLTDPELFGIGRRHITVSTVGIVPKIMELSKARTGVKLAVSLHAPDDRVRRVFVPEKIGYGVEQVMKAAADFARENDSVLTVEYALVAGENDSMQNAEKLVKLIRRTDLGPDSVKVNLIPFNPTRGMKWRPPSEEETAKFCDVLKSGKVLAIVRKAKGADIGSACGQLGI